MTTPGKSRRHSCPRRPPSISQAEARRRAAAHLLKRLFRGAKVRDGVKNPPAIYARHNGTPKNVWVVYTNPDTLALQSSHVLLVCKRTGRILYEGSAPDEG